MENLMTPGMYMHQSMALPQKNELLSWLMKNILYQVDPTDPTGLSLANRGLPAVANNERTHLTLQPTITT